MHVHTRQMAKVLGLKRYYDGRPCRNGHTSMRDTKTCVCIACRAMHHQKRITRINRAAITGISDIKLSVHAKDRQTLIEFNEALTLARTLTESLK